MDCYYNLYIKIPSKFVQGIYTYLNNKCIKKATWDELLRYFDSISTPENVVCTLQLAIKGGVTNDQVLADYIIIPTDIGLIDPGKRGALQSSLRKHGCEFLFDLTKKCLPPKERFLVILQLGSEGEISAVIKIADLTYTEINDEEWPDTIPDPLNH